MEMKTPYGAGTTLIWHGVLRIFRLSRRCSFITKRDILYEKLFNVVLCEWVTKHFNNGSIKLCQIFLELWGAYLLWKNFSECCHWHVKNWPGETRSTVAPTRKKLPVPCPDQHQGTALDSHLCEETYQIHLGHISILAHTCKNVHIMKYLGCSVQ